MSKKRCMVLIDGSNFYFKLKDLKLHDELKFDFSSFAKMLCGEGKIVDSLYYVGAVRTNGTKHVQMIQIFYQQSKKPKRKERLLSI